MLTAKKGFLLILVSLHNTDLNDQCIVAVMFCKQMLGFWVPGFWNVGILDVGMVETLGG